MPVFQSAACRDTRLAYLLRDNSTLSSSDMLRFMSDHGHDEVPSSDTICMHGSHWSTLATVELNPGERTMSVGYGPAYEANYTTFEV